MTALSHTSPILDITPETLEDQARLLAAMARSTAEAHELVFELKHELAIARETFRAEGEAELQDLREQLTAQVNEQTILEASLREQSELLAQRDQDNQALRKELLSRDAQMASLWDQIELRDRQLPALKEALEAFKARLAMLETEKQEALERVERLETFHRELLASTSWRITAPLRGLGEALRKD